MRYFIVGGGPSLIGFDFRLLDNKKVIAVNKSFLELPNAEVLYFSDARFYHWMREFHNKEFSEFKGRKITAALKKYFPTSNDLEFYKFTGTAGIDMRHGCLRSNNNSGAAALNLAAQLGAKEIVLLGFDMKFDGNKSHYHDGYPIKNRERLFDNMLKYFDSMAEALRDLDIQIFNTSMSSAITCFPKAPIGDFL